MSVHPFVIEQPGWVVGQPFVILQPGWVVGQPFVILQPAWQVTAHVLPPPTTTAQVLLHVAST